MQSPHACTGVGALVVVTRMLVEKGGGKGGRRVGGEGGLRCRSGSQAMYCTYPYFAPSKLGPGDGRCGLRLVGMSAGLQGFRASGLELKKEGRRH